MRFFGLISIFAVMGWSASVYAAEGHSKQYVQCMNAAANQNGKAEKCLKKEIKYHTKRMNKAYKQYLKANNTNANVIKNQHQQWESHLKQQCQHKTAGQYNKVQQGQCRLTMTIVQANRYGAKTISGRK